MGACSELVLLYNMMFMVSNTLLNNSHVMLGCTLKSFQVLNKECFSTVTSKVLSAQCVGDDDYSLICGTAVRLEVAKLLQQFYFIFFSISRGESSHADLVAHGNPIYADCYMEFDCFSRNCLTKTLDWLTFFARLVTR